nr:serine/threonine protein kinase [uncultured bacterium]
MPPDLPARVGRYEIEGVIGRGGMGVVLRGRDPSCHRTLAIKLLRDGPRAHPDAEQRFLEEAQVTAQLQHPGVPPVHEIGRHDDGRLFFSMKLVRGQTLAELLASREGPTEDLPRFLAVFEQVCQTVAFAHSRGILHRDLKPANVMVGAFGEVQVMDWGLAKVLGREAPEAKRPSPAEMSAIRTVRTAADGLLSQAGTVIGTPAYMAPEQARGEMERVDERADVFGLGAVLCAVLTGHPPYVAPTEEVYWQATRADLTEAFRRLDSCGAEARLVLLARACLSPAREDRPRDAGAVARAVADYQAGVQDRLRQAELDRAEAQVKAREERKRRRLTLALAATALVILALVGGGAWWLDRQRSEAARLEQQATQAVRQAMNETEALRERAWQAPLGDLALYRETLAAARKAHDLALQGPVAEGVREESRALVGQAEAELAAAEKDRRLLDTCLDISAPREGPTFRRDSSGTMTTVQEPDADEQLGAAFRAYGLDVDSQRTEQLAAGLRRPRAALMEIASVLDSWAAIRREKGRPEVEWRRLAEMAQAIDPDPERDEVRAILARGKLRQEGVMWLVTQVSFPLSTLTGQVPGPDHNRLRQLARRADTERGPVLGLMLLAKALEECGDNREAENLLRAALRARPGEVLLHQELGEVLLRQQPPRWQEAAECYTVARAFRPGLGVTLARVLDGCGRGEEGLALLRWLAQQQSDNPFFRLRLANGLHEKGRMDEAIRAYREAIRLDPRDAATHFNLALALKAKGQLDEAIAAYREAIRLDPRDAAAHNNLGVALKARGQLDEAIAAYHPVIPSWQWVYCPRTFFIDSRWPSSTKPRRRPTTSARRRARRREISPGVVCRAPTQGLNPFASGPRSIVRPHALVAPPSRRPSFGQQGRPAAIRGPVCASSRVPSRRACRRPSPARRTTGPRHRRRRSGTPCRGRRPGQAARRKRQRRTGQQPRGGPCPADTTRPARAARRRLSAWSSLPGRRATVRRAVATPGILGPSGQGRETNPAAGNPTRLLVGNWRAPRRTCPAL